ncbi:MAG: PilZ domain-containing protein [Dissulfurispiraceae bacterium]|jgi:hypothetical protein
MNARLNNQLAPIEVLSEGRRYQRFVKEGAATITFRGLTVTGNLVNLSVSGVLANFSSRDPLPGMSEEVNIHLEAGGQDNILELHGTIVRIQVPREYENQDLIAIAVNFVDLRPAVKHGLQKLIEYLLVKAIRYK